jgi:hypothetical protein
VVLGTRVAQVQWWTHDGDPSAWWALEFVRWLTVAIVIGWLYVRVAELGMRLDSIRDFSLRELAGDAEDEDVLRSIR